MEEPLLLSAPLVVALCAPQGKMGGPQPALVGVRGPQAGGQYYGCGRHMSIPPGQVWEGGERTDSKEEGEQLGREVKEEKSKREGLERGKDEEELRRRDAKTKRRSDERK